MRRLEDELKEVEENLANLIRYAIDYFKNLLQKYGKGRERKTELTNFNTISATVVAAANQKLYVNKLNGFIGYSLKKDEYVMDCSDIDDIIVIRLDGTCIVTKVQEKVFVGKDIIYCSVFKKNDDRKVFNICYLDGKTGITYCKRFKVTSITRDREYKLVANHPKSKITYFSANENGEAEIVQISLTANCTAKIKQFDYDFANLSIKGRESLGNKLTKYPIRKIIQKSVGISTLGGVDIWYDPTIGRLNRDQHGNYIGNFEPNNYILAIYSNGNYELTNFELTNRYPAEEILYLKRFNSKNIISAVYFDGNNKSNYIKRFKLETTTIDKKFLFISESKNSKLITVTDNYLPNVQIKHKSEGKPNETNIIPITSIVEIRGWKAIGSKLNYSKILDIQFIETEENDSLEIIDTEEENESSNMVDNNPTYTVDNNLSDELSDEIPLKIMNNQLDNSDSSKIVKPISLEKTEGLSYNNEMDDIPFEIKMTNDEIEVPTTIKSIPDENLDSDQNKGSQLGLF
jgi:topoisomerase-4 subunit A